MALMVAYTRANTSEPSESVERPELEPMNRHFEGLGDSKNVTVRVAQTTGQSMALVSPVPPSCRGAPSAVLP